ncbi:DUF2254 domain-containing protein [Neptunomonas qingdaonensis]|uniref:Uncharacterized membrane protein n=1 Tax=Neptunomonas qingdaonensis TaxID=1045558 RepID=A0A1I2S6D7_9GAMM|nr:DUF2254 domain-containing protein [Neptunomonas qingdaonensis]SFG48464.1 Uncharacterized membrane protein [Neptunomonas qingdaonensis]
MAALISGDRLRFVLSRLRERLWLKPFVVCLLSIACVFAAKIADSNALLIQVLPSITAKSLDTLLSIMASSMLVIATFSVTSMVSAYSSAANTATPRSFTLIIADDASQNALSTFVGAFIFSIVALTAVKNGYFERAGLLLLFCLTAVVFSIVIITFVRWVDSIARLGRMGSTINKVEAATAKALKRRRDAPTLQGGRMQSPARGQPVFAVNTGYVQHIDMAMLQKWAEEAQVGVVVAALPGTLVGPGRPVAYVSSSPDHPDDMDFTCVIDAFHLGVDRLFDDDPRFGLVVLSEIAGRALSPAVNDPGTAIAIVGAFLRLFTQWSEPVTKGSQQSPKYERIEVPEISIQDMFDDAFTAIARDGAGVVEVSVRLQKALHSLATIDDLEMRNAAGYHAQLALKRARLALNVEEDIAVVQAAAQFSQDIVSSKNYSPLNYKQ